MAGRANNNKLPNNLPQLQNLIKRDPASYAEEFERQHSLYSATLSIFEQNPTVHNRQLDELVNFLAQVASCYTEQLAQFPDELMTLLRKYASVLHQDMRLALVKALVLLRNKGLLAPTALLVLFFELLRCQDKSLRQFLKDHIITDIKNINAKSKNMKLNKELQNFMFVNLNNNHAVAVKTSLDIMVELYNKRIWNDAKTVNIISTACFSKITKVMVAALKFFLGKDEEAEEESDSDSESEPEKYKPNIRAIKLANRVNKKTKKRMKRLESSKKALKKGKKSKKNKEAFDFSAIHLIHDPQQMCDKLFKRLEKMNERFEVKLLVMNVVSRLIGIHELYVPNFYPLVNRFLFPHQREVTRVMVFAAQAAHPLVPPDELEPVIRTLANNFVTERHAAEVMAMGLNAIRELCARNPYCMSEELLQDLVQFKTYKDKGVMMASRSLISLFREKNPSLLMKKDRGAPSELRMESKREGFGELTAKDYIPGAEVLSVEGAENSETLNINSDDESDDGEWINVSHADDSDGEDDGNEDGEDEDDEGEEVSDEDEESEDDDESDDKENEGKKNTIKKSANKPKSDKAVAKGDSVSEVMKMTPEERAAKAAETVTSRFLTNEEFERIAKVQAAKSSERYSKSKKRKHNDDDESTNRGEVVKLSSIEMVYKKRAHDKESRLASVMKGREDRGKFGAKKGKVNPNASSTNKEKKKTKNFMMLKHKVRRKQKTSFREKQLKLKNSLLKQRRTIIK